MLRLLADENFNHDLVRGVLRRRPGVDLVHVHDVGLTETDDAEILAWAANEGRVVLTHDVNTMMRSAVERVQSGEPMAGVFIAHQEGAALSTIIDDLLLLSAAKRQNGPAKSCSCRSGSSRCETRRRTRTMGNMWGSCC